MLTNQRIEELVIGIDQYLQKIHSFSDDLREVKATLDELKNSKEEIYMCELQKIRIQLQTVNHELYKRGLPEISEYESQFREAKKLLMSEEWPRAVDPKSIIVTEEKAFGRAQQILDLIVGESLTDKSFLDFGCGAGHVVMQSLNQNPKIALGYDIDASKIKFNETNFTSELDFVKLKGPYDVVLMFDVLDHIENSNPVDILKQVKSMMSNNGKLFIRNHPWCSRHGSHLYTKINKAYAHLVFDDSELSRIGGYANDHTLKLSDPLETYKSWFSESGFKIYNEIPFIKNIEDYFKESLITNRMIDFWDGDYARMMKNIQLEFVEYVLEPIQDEAII